MDEITKLYNLDFVYSYTFRISQRYLLNQPEFFLTVHFFGLFRAMNSGELAL